VNRATLLGLALLACARSAPTWKEIDRRIHAEFPQVRSITTAELAAWLQNPARPQKPLLLDVRAPAEFEVSHLAQAHLAPTVEQALEAIEPGRPVVLYCSVGFRSAKMAAKLQRLGVEKVFNLKGSIFRWANEGRPVYAQGRKVKKVHPFDRRWGRLLDPDLHG